MEVLTSLKWLSLFSLRMDLSHFRPGSTNQEFNEWRHSGVTDADCVAFAALTGDANPIHFDEDGAGDGGRLGGRAVHGMLAASGFGALLARVKPGTVYASQELKFRRPIRVDEEVEIEIALVKRSGRRVRYETVVRKVACGTVCVDGFALALLPE